MSKRAGFPSLAFHILKHTIPAQDFIFLNGNFADLYEDQIKNRCLWAPIIL